MKLLLGLFVALAIFGAATISLQPNESGELNCVGDKLTFERQSITRVLYNCIVYTPVPTVEPTVEPTATTPPVADVAPYAAAPACVDHDSRAYHGLWNSQSGCYYDHHHGDDPSQLDAVFGTDYYDLAGGEISYPWQTFSDAGLENDLKHEGYYWLVRTNLPCPTSPSPGCITDFRAQVHQMADGHDTPVRYHSFALEARVCLVADLNNCGIARIGGWQDTGTLEVDGVAVISPEGAHNRVKQHSSTSGGAVWYPSSQVAENGRQGLARVSLTIYDMWDYTNPANPSDYTDRICWGNPRCRNNGTQFLPHLIVVDVPAEFEDIVDPDGDGIANYEGYLNRYGTPVEGCTAVGLDCVPVKLVNVRTDIGYSVEGNAGVARDYDIYFGNRPSGWNRPPGE